MALNHVDFQGHLVDAPSFGDTNSGTRYANFRLGWNEKYKDKETKCFLECKTFSGTAQFMEKYMNQKGQEIVVEGKLNTEEWTNNEGQKRSKIVLIVSGVHFAGSRKDGVHEAEDNTPVPQPTAVSTDELPF